MWRTGLIGVALVAMNSFIKLGCRVRVAPVMVSTEQFGAGGLVGGTMDLVCKESYDNQSDVSKCYILFGMNEVSLIIRNYGPGVRELTKSGGSTAVMAN